MRLLVDTQVHENYAMHDGVIAADGSFPQYWKAKGGSTYQIATLSYQEIIAMGSKGVEALVEANKHNWAADNAYFHEYTIGYTLIEDNELTWLEKSYAEYGDTGAVQFLNGTKAYEGDKEVFCAKAA